MSLTCQKILSNFLLHDKACSLTNQVNLCCQNHGSVLPAPHKIGTNVILLERLSMLAR